MHEKMHQVSALPVGSGTTSTAKSLNNTNVLLTQLSAQTIADTKYDPTSPKPEKQAMKIVNGEVVQNAALTEAFHMPYQTIQTSLYIIGSLFIIYGIIAK